MIERMTNMVLRERKGRKSLQNECSNITERERVE